MSKLSLIVLCFFLFFKNEFYSQNIGGAINAYASVSLVSGSNLGVSTSTAFNAGDRLLLVQMKGATIVTTNTNTFGNISSMGGAGTYEFLDVSYASGTLIALASNPTHTYNTTTGFVQVVRVPKYCMPIVTSSITCPAWNPATGMGGIIAFEAGTLTLNADINANASGFVGGFFGSGGFNCNSGSYVGTAGSGGGRKGESISAYISGSDGLKGKQANGGGGSNTGNSGGGGGGNGGIGGIGGNEYSGCSAYDDRGLGGLAISPSYTTMFFGGAGGGGFQDNSQTCTPGGNGGGIIYIRANLINCNSRTITAAGGNVAVVSADEGSGGGGAGGSVFIECVNFSGNLTVNTNGGNGGSSYNTLFTGYCHGPGGGGGGGVLALSSANLPAGFTFNSTGGAAGTVNNPSSSCYNTTFGAAAGANGFTVGSLPYITQAFTTPTISVVQSNSICSGQTASLTASGATTYSWNTGNSPTNPVLTVTPPTSTQYTVIGYNGTCSSSAIYNVPVTPLPPLSTSGTTAICSGQSAVLTVTGATSYVWTTGSTATLITVSPLTTTAYSVTGTANGCTATASRTLNVTTTPTISITSTLSICSGETATLYVGTASSYSWNTGATSATIAISPTVGTFYNVTGYNGNCSVTATKYMNVTPVPTLNVVGVNSLCAGTSATIGVSGAGNYLWSTGSTSQSITLAPTLIGINFYTVTGTSGGCSSTYIHSLSVIPMPTITISGNSNLCSGKSATLSAFYASTYLWSTGATSSLIIVTPATSTSYSLIGANGACTVSAVKNISVTPSPPVIATAFSASVCSGNSMTLTASGAPAYYWSNGSTNTVITVMPYITTTYSLYGTSNNCTSLSTITLTVIPTPTLSSANYSLCVGHSGAIMTVSGASSYVWSPNYFLSATAGSVTTANPINTTTYVVTGYNTSCSSSLQVVVQTFTAPNVYITSSANYVCKGNSVNLNASGANVYHWEPASAFQNSSSETTALTPLSTTAYTLYGYSGNNCAGVAIKTIEVLVTPEVYVSAGTNVICKGSTMELYGSGSATSYSWSPTDGLSSNSQATVTASPVTTQIYTLTGYNGVIPYVCSSQVTIGVNVYPYSAFSIAAPDSICYLERVVLKATGAQTYTWSPSTFLTNAYSANPTIIPKSSLIYTVTGVGSGSCATTRTLSIGIKPIPFVYAGRDTTINFDQYTFLKGSGEGILYTWKGSDLSALNCINCPETYVHPQTSTCYFLEIENAFGCKASDDVCVEVTNDYAIYIPNTFSPNGDGTNDLFTPLGFGVLSFELFIYNRWGEKLFEGKGSFTEGPLVSWDGNFKGQRCKTDSYIYNFIYILPGSKKLTKQGEIILLAPKN